MHNTDLVLNQLKRRISVWCVNLFRITFSVLSVSLFLTTYHSCGYYYTDHAFTLFLEENSHSIYCSIVFKFCVCVLH